MILFAKDKQQFVEIETGNRTGQIKTKCPLCADDRKKKTDKSLSVNIKEEVANCHHCGESFFKKAEFVKQEKTYAKVNWSNKTELSDKAVKWFEGRMIRQSTLSKMGIVSKTEYMPQVEKEMNCICFPFKKNGQVVNVKFRDGYKNFKLVSGAEKVLYNLDCIEGANYLIITEGEIDALTFIDIGYENVVSVPNGASTNTEYLDDVIEKISSIPTVYLATDNDTKGLLLREELLRRIGYEVCKIIDFGECKDANEVLCKQGVEKLKSCIEDSKPEKIDGVFTVTDFEDKLNALFENGMPKGMTIGSPQHDELISFETKRIGIITGIPGHGKSEYIDWVVCKLNKCHGWKSVYFSPENHPLELHASKLAEKFIGKKFGKDTMQMQEYNLFKAYSEKNFQFLMPEEDWSLDNIIAKAKFCVKMYGSKIFIIDAYNKLEHKIPSGMSETNYVSKMLDDLIAFAKKYNSLIFLVAHPRKMYKDDHGEYEVPNLYSISGSANFFNKADYGISFYRHSGKEGGLSNNSTAHIQKVKFKHLGKTGAVNFSYNINNGRLEELVDEELKPRMWDNSNWLPDSEFLPRDIVKVEKKINVVETGNYETIALSPSRRGEVLDEMGKDGLDIWGG